MSSIQFASNTPTTVLTGNQPSTQTMGKSGSLSTNSLNPSFQGDLTPVNQASGGLPVNETHQGSYGDCTLIAAVNDLVTNNPDFLAHHVVFAGDTSSGSQIYNVNLYENGQWSMYSVNTANVPSNGSRDANGQVNIGSVYENALAQAHGGYAGINSGAPPEATLLEVTGTGIGTVNFLGDRNALTHAMSSHATVASLGTGQQEGWYNAQTGSYDGKTQKAGDVYISATHCYSVLKAAGNSGNAAVTIQNPYINQTNGGGTFTVSADAFCKIFAQTAWSLV